MAPRDRVAKSAWDGGAAGGEAGTAVDGAAGGGVGAAVEGAGGGLAGGVVAGAGGAAGPAILANALAAVRPRCARASFGSSASAASKSAIASA
jgi:hypothetical protein